MAVRRCDIDCCDRELVLGRFCPVAFWAVLGALAAGCASGYVAGFLIVEALRILG